MQPPFEKEKSLGTRLKSMLFTGLPLLGLPSYKFSFRSSVQKNGPPGEGRHEGLVPRNDVLTNGFIWFSLARTLARILFVPRLRSPWKTHKALRTWRKLFALFEAIRSWESGRFVNSERIIDRCSTWAIKKHNLWARYFTSWRHYGWRLDCKPS